MIEYALVHVVYLMLPAHFDDVTDDISRLLKTKLVKILEELPKSQTRNIKSNYEKYRTLHEYNTNLRSRTRCDKSIARILDNPKIFPLSCTDRQQHRESGRVA